MISLGKRVVRVVVAVTATSGLVVGCSSGPEPEPVPSATSQAPTPTPTPTPTSTDSQIAGTVVDLSDPELGIVFEDVPDLTGDEADVYNWVSTFELEYWRTLSTNEPSPAFSVFTSPEVQAGMATMAASNAEQGLTFAGTFHARVSAIVVTGDTATAITCDDYRDVTISGPDGPRSLESEGADVPVRSEVGLARSTTGVGVWTVLTNTSAGSC